MFVQLWEYKMFIKEHPIRQVASMALQVSFHIGWGCLLDCPLHFLEETPKTYHSPTTSYLSVSLIH